MSSLQQIITFMSVKGIHWFLQVCLQCILYENLCIGELWKMLGVCKMSTWKHDVYRMCPGKTRTLGTNNMMVLVRLLLLISSRKHPIFARRNLSWCTIYFGKISRHISYNVLLSSLCNHTNLPRGGQCVKKLRV